MRLKRFLPIFAFCCLVVFCLPISAKAVSYIYGTVSGPSAELIEGAFVDSGTGVTTYSFADGFYILAVAQGTYTVTVSARGFQTQTAEVSIVSDGTSVIQDFSIALAELGLDAVYPTLGELGEDLDVTLTGTAFDQDTRVSMYLDAGNTKSILAEVPPWQGISFPVDVAFEGKYAYLVETNTEGGLRVIDISDSKNPAVVDSVQTPGWSNGVAVRGDYAFIADYAAGLQIVDVSEPTNLVLHSQPALGVEAKDIAIQGNYAFVAAGGDGLRIYDISAPTAPQLITASVDTPNDAVRIAVSGNYAYIADSTSVQVIDISNPLNPIFERTLIGGYSLYAKNVTVSGNYLYATSGGGVRIFDIGAAPGDPQFVADAKIRHSGGDVAIAGNYAYVADSGAGVTAIDITDPSNPILLGSISCGDARGIEVSGKYAYVAATDGFRVVEISPPPPSPILIGSETDAWAAENIELSGDYAFLAAKSLTVVDISNPENPTEIAYEYPSAGTVRDLALQNDYAYLASQDGGLQIVDISNPASPQLQPNSIATTGQALGVSVAGDYAYIAVADFSNQLGRFYSISIADPLNPVVTNGAITTDSARDVAVSGNWAFIADCSAGIQSINVSNPAQPVKGGAVATTGCAQGIAVSGSYAYVVDWNGLYIFDIGTAPNSPQLLSYTETQGWAWSVRVYGNMAYVADAYSGIQAFDVSDPYDPILIGNAETPGRAEDVVVADGIAYVADLAEGLSIVPAPVEVTIPAAPSGILSDTEIDLTLPSPIISGRYSIRVFNDTENDELPGAVTFTQDSQTLNAKAIIIAGGGPNAPGNIWEETKLNANKAYDVLIQQGYDHDSIFYLSMESGNVFVDRASLDTFLYDAIFNWAGGTETSELLIYMVDHGEPGEFILYSDGDYYQRLKAEDFDEWLDALQTGSMNGTVTVIYDACESGSFVSKLRPPEGSVRYVITSASNEPAFFLNNGQEAFSYQFWDGILLNEGNLGEAFSIANATMQAYQTALLDADGNGIANEPDDFIAAQNSVIKRGSPSFIPVKPYIEDVTVSIFNTTTLKLSASGVIDADTVIAQIIPPDVNPEATGVPVTDLTSIALSDSLGDGNYSGDFGEFTKNGTYLVSVKGSAAVEVYSYVTGAMANRVFYSDPHYSFLTQNNGTPINDMEDDFEVDNDIYHARVILVNDSEKQPHNFHASNDEDWVQFHGVSGNSYIIKAGNPSVPCDTILEVHDGSGPANNPIKGPINDAGPGEAESVRFDCEQDGVYFVRVRNANGTFGENVRYDLSVYQPIGGVGSIIGRVTDELDDYLDGVRITANVGSPPFYTETFGGGYYIITVPSGTITLSTVMTGFAPQELTVVVNDGADVRDQDFILPPADITLPTATISYSTTGPTNQSVIATLNPSETVTITNNGGLSTRTFTSNGSFTFNFHDAADNTGSATATVSNIDKTAPTYTIAYTPDTLTNQNVTATISLSDVNNVTVTSTGGASHVFSANGTHTFSFTDAAGNSGTAVASVNWIDKVAPTGTVSYSTTSVTNQNVTATLDVGDAVTVTSAGGASHVFTTNGTHTFTFSDAAGNTGAAQASVSWIDKTPPTATIAYSTTDPTNQAVTATITVIGGAVTSGGTTHVFTANGTYLFTFADTAGNIGSALAAVDWIDRTPPSASISYNTTSLTNQNVTASLSLSDINEVTVTSAGGGTHTFDSNGTFTFTFVDAAGNTDSAAATVNWIDKTPPTAALNYSTTTLTNQDVIVTLQPSEAIVVTNNGGSAARTFTANGSFTFTFTDAAGNAGTATATVANIDKTVPTYTLAYAPATLTNQNVIATLTLSDGNVTSAGGSTHTFTENGTFTFEFEDAAGNTGTVLAEVDWIDTTPPNAAISYSTTSLTNQNVVATIILSDGTVTSPGGNTHTFSSNGAFTFTFTDTAGSTGSAAATVNWIDKTPPTASITYNTTDATNQNVLAVLNASESITVTNNSGASTRLFIENGSFTFTFEDAAGNTGSATATVGNIDKSAPTYTIVYSPDTLTNQDVTATINLSEGTVTSAGGNDHTFTENGTFTFVYADPAGNTGTALAMVNWIDKTPPPATIVYSTTAPTTHDVTATLVPGEAVLVTNNGGSTLRSFSDNGTFTFEYKDAAGNIGTTTATVSNIYLSDPVAVLSNAPSGIVTTSSFSIVVGGEDVDQYKYKMDNGLYGPAVDVGTPISLTDVSEGTHTLQVIGANAADIWQVESEATSASWEIVCRGNINGDDFVNLVDAIIVLKILAGADSVGMLRSDFAGSGSDIGNNTSVGLEDVLYILQKEASFKSKS
jgi:hypothetical protein